MKNKELFDRTIRVLVRAYFDGTLASGDCACCAVGNLVCAGSGIKLSPEPWGNSTLDRYRQWGGPILGNEPFKTLAISNIKATGYSAKELAQIEKAFEKHTSIHWKNYSEHTGKEIENDQYNGLMAVCDALMQIHEVGAKEIKEAKQLFVRI